MSVYHMHGWCPWRQMRALDSLELELEMVLRLHVGDGSWMWVLCKYKWGYLTISVDSIVSLLDHVFPPTMTTIL